MAARGSASKAEISKKILQTFPNSFLYNDGKEIRIEMVEDSIPLQIKVTLTAAKNMVEREDGAGAAFPISNTGAAAPNFPEPPSKKVSIPQEPTQEEKDTLATLLNQLGLD